MIGETVKVDAFLREDRRVKLHGFPVVRMSELGVVGAASEAVRTGTGTEFTVVVGIDDALIIREDLVLLCTLRIACGNLGGTGLNRVRRGQGSRRRNFVGLRRRCN